MPNWVYNNVSVSGNKDDLIAFANKASQQHETQWLSKDWIRNEDGTNTRVPEEERTIEIEMSDKTPISFWNFIRPTDEELPYYFGNLVKEEDKPDPDATLDERMAKAMTFSGSGWYDWNIREWGTKWDANDENGEFPDLDDLKEHDSISYSFSTAWSVPQPIFEAMVKQHPELDFDFSSEEEQGWGVEFTSSDGEEDGEERSLIETRSWDIPASHADYVERDNIDGCVCNWDADDEDNWFEDCPRPEKDFFVVVTKTYRVTTHTAENAWELAQDNDPDEQMELLDETSIWVKGENGERLFPTLGDGEPTEKLCDHRLVPVYKAGEDGEGNVYSGVLSCVFCNEERESETDEIVTEVNK